MSNIFPPRIRTRAYFSTYHLWASKNFSEKCHSIENAHRGPSQFIIEHRALAIASLVEAGAFLEAVVNELFKDCAERNTTYTKPLPQPSVESLAERWTNWHKDGRKTIPTLQKFDAALTGCNQVPFDKGAAPYQDAALVLDLRNALLHFTPEWVSSDQQHQFDILKSKFPANRLMAGSGNAYFPDKCLGAGCCAWASTSVLAYANEFFARLAVQPHYQASTFLRPEP